MQKFNPKIIIHADDLGASVNGNESIFKLFDLGVLSSSSLMANGEAFEDAVQRIKKQKIPISIHINIFEGRPVVQKIKLSLLINNNGVFKFNFFKLLLVSYLSPVGYREQLKKEIESEIEAQVLLVKDRCRLTKIIIDGHQHVHLIPIVLEVLLENAEKWGIERLRRIREPLVFSTFSDLRPFFSLNLLKWIILNLLDFLQVKTEPTLRLFQDGVFYGVLYAERLQPNFIRKVLAVLNKQTRLPTQIEFLFHPGRLNSTSENKFSQINYVNYYSSPKRYSEFVNLSENVDFFQKIKRE